MQSVTKKKIHWLSGGKEAIFEVLSQFISEDQLEEQYGGKNTYKITKKENLQ